MPENRRRSLLALVVLITSFFMQRLFPHSALQHNCPGWQSLSELHLSSTLAQLVELTLELILGHLPTESLE